MVRAKTSSTPGRLRAFAPVQDAAWRTRRISGVEILSARLLDSIPWLIHGFSTRKGGESRLNGARALNLGFTDWDSRQAVIQNRAKFARASGAANMPLVALRQIHSDVVQVFSAAPAEPLQADAAATRQSGLALAVQTADCVPILLADTRRRAIAAVHAGWRGTLARIVVKTIGRMRLEFGTQPEDISAALGPAIGRCCYEVGPEVAQAFSGQFPNASEWFDGPFERLASGEEPNPLPWLTMMPPGHELPPERVRLDLRAANRSQLIDSGVRPRNIAVSALCTACRTDLLFSYRREGARTGRLMALMGIRQNSR